MEQKGYVEWDKMKATVPCASLASDLPLMFMDLWELPRVLRAAMSTSALCMPRKHMSMTCWRNLLFEV